MQHQVSVRIIWCCEEIPLSILFVGLSGCHECGGARQQRRVRRIAQHHMVAPNLAPIWPCAAQHCITPCYYQLLSLLEFTTTSRMQWAGYNNTISCPLMEMMLWCLWGKYAVDVAAASLYQHFWREGSPPQHGRRQQQQHTVVDAISPAQQCGPTRDPPPCLSLNCGVN